jgi:hypothetical protein
MSDAGRRAAAGDTLAESVQTYLDHPAVERGFARNSQRPTRDAGAARTRESGNDRGLHPRRARAPPRSASAISSRKLQQRCIG